MNARSKYLRTFGDTAWIYPIADIDYALSTTTHPYTRTGNNIVCSNFANFAAVYTDIFTRTTVTQPVGNVGYSLGVGTMLEDLGKDIEFKLTGGQVLLRWRLVRQLTPQVLGAIPVPGNSPAGTVGYITAFTSYPPSPGILDTVLVVRTG
jgi:hypothetical protein